MNNVFVTDLFKNYDFKLRKKCANCYPSNKNRDFLSFTNTNQGF